MLAISKFDIPGDAGFPLNSVYAKPSNPTENGEYIYFYIFFPSLHYSIDNNKP